MNKTNETKTLKFEYNDTHSVVAETMIAPNVLRTFNVLTLFDYSDDPETFLEKTGFWRYGVIIKEFVIEDNGDRRFIGSRRSHSEGDHNDYKDICNARLVEDAPGLVDEALALWETR